MIEPELYGASCSEVMERLHQVPADVVSVMVIGHNPAMQMLVLRLAAAGGQPHDGSGLADVQRKFPTGALAEVVFECDWSELAPGCAKLAGLVRPKDLR